MNLHTYHHICSTLLLSTPYALTSLPRRAPPAEDGAYILPLPDLNQLSAKSAQRGAGEEEGEGEGEDEGLNNDHSAGMNDAEMALRDGGEAAHEVVQSTSQADLVSETSGAKDREGDQDSMLYPSLLSPYCRPARKLLVVRREDGYEVRRAWRCGRCGGVVGYEIVGHGQGAGEGRAGLGDGLEEDGLGEGGKVLYLIEGGLVETGAWGDGEDG